MAIGVTLGLGNLIGGLAGAATSVYGANKSAEIATENTAKQLAWEKERATNAHQWEIEDLQKAGLNPILSAGGSGAVTGGITPQLPDTSGYSKAGEALGQIFNQIITAQNMQANTAKQSAEADNIREQTGLTKIQIISEKLRHGLIKADTAVKKVEKILRNLDVEHYNERFQNQISYNLPGITKHLNAWIEKVMEDYGISKEKTYQWGRNWKEAEENFKETYRRVTDPNNWIKTW